MKCIFCKKEKPSDQFVPEHVFSESIGGSFKIDSVCRRCNSDLGTKVDSKLADHFFVKLIRYQLGLVGKKGRMPVPIRQGELVGSPADKSGPVKVRLTHNKTEDGLHGSVIPKRFDSRTIENGVEWQKYVGPDDKDSFTSMIQSFCRHHGQPEPSTEEISKLYDHVKNNLDGIDRPIEIAPGVLFRGKLEKADPNLIECEIAIDKVQYKPAIVKIAYELACEWLGLGYLEDPSAERLRRFILDPSFRAPPKENAIKGGVDFLRIPFQADPLGEQSYSHMARICYSNEGLVCEVIVFGMIRGWMIVTEDPSLYRLFIPHQLDMNPTERGEPVVRLLQGVVSRSSAGNFRNSWNTILNF